MEPMEGGVELRKGSGGRKNRRQLHKVLRGGGTRDDVKIRVGLSQAGTWGGALKPKGSCSGGAVWQPARRSHRNNPGRQTLAAWLRKAVVTPDGQSQGTGLWQRAKPPRKSVTAQEPAYGIEWCCQRCGGVACRICSSVIISITEYHPPTSPRPCAPTTTSSLHWQHRGAVTQKHGHHAGPSPAVGPCLLSPQPSPSPTALLLGATEGILQRAYKIRNSGLKCDRRSCACRPPSSEMFHDSGSRDRAMLWRVPPGISREGRMKAILREEQEVSLSSVFKVFTQRQVRRAAAQVGGVLDEADLTVP
ncbi:hypothetical protein JZ751_029273 [Albula glossodonta]|uniref:Uncharacterized protein n=1 Tax=Albula glossodonta TaxID=121402 RepID=A0A8T2PB61_9TELE|nr:hypothetical protein JZ751_029273 [Albula glossodonta]